MSSFNESIDETSRLILKNPDGTYMHCYKSGEEDSIYSDAKSKMEENKKFEELSLSDENLEYIMNNYEYFSQTNIISKILTNVKSNLFLLTLFIMIDISIFSYLSYIYCSNKNYTKFILAKYYLNIDLNLAEIYYYILLSISILINIIFYGIGFYGVYYKKFKILKVFSYYALIIAIFSFFAAYINIIYLILFINRMIIFPLSRYVCNLLIASILLPYKMEMNNRNNYDTFE